MSDRIQGHSALALVLLALTSCYDEGVAGDSSSAEPLIFTAAVGEASLIGYWPFDGDGVDASGSGNNLGLNGGLGFGSGLFAQSLNFTGNIALYAAGAGDDAEFDFGASDFTIQLWVNFLTIQGEQTLFEKFTGSNGPGWTLTKLGNNVVQFYAQPAILLNSNPITIPLGQWHHFLARRTGSQLQIYFNGTAIATGSLVSNIPDTAAALLVGRRGLATQGFPVNGRIDELAVWRSALTAGEIAFLYNGGAGNPVDADFNPPPPPPPPPAPPPEPPTFPSAPHTSAEEKDTILPCAAGSFAGPWRLLLLGGMIAVVAARRYSRPHGGPRK